MTPTVRCSSEFFPITPLLFPPPPVAAAAEELRPLPPAPAWPNGLNSRRCCLEMLICRAIDISTAALRAASCSSTETRAAALPDVATVSTERRDATEDDETDGDRPVLFRVDGVALFGGLAAAAATVEEEEGEVEEGGVMISHSGSERSGLKAARRETGRGESTSYSIEDVDEEEVALCGESRTRLDSLG